MKVALELEGLTDKAYADQSSCISLPYGYKLDVLACFCNGSFVLLESWTNVSHLISALSLHHNIMHLRICTLGWNSMQTGESHHVLFHSIAVLM